MGRKLFPLLLLVLLLATQLGAAEPTDSLGQATVNEAVLIARCGPNASFEAVARLKKHTTIHVLEIRHGWVAMPAPEDAVAWVAGGHLVNDHVASDHAAVRAGPAQGFTIFATLPRGAGVAVIARRGDGWVRIVAPAEARVWVPLAGLNGVSTPEADGRQAEGILAPPPADAGTEDYSDWQLAPPHPGAEPTTPETPPVFTGAPKFAVYTGVVVVLDGRPGPQNCLVASALRGRLHPLAYLSCTHGDVAAWAGRRVRLEGDARWVAGWPRPVLDVHRLTPAP